jgi:hypothetical protein
MTLSLPAKKADLDCSLIGVQVENLRGFRKATLDLERPLTLLVGPNNSGKTSLLRLLDWAINELDHALLTGRRSLSTAEAAMLLPARDTRGAARRLTLMVSIPDGRRARRFSSIDRVARLRIKVIGSGVYAAVSQPKRSEPRESERAAIDLLDHLRSSMTLVLIPAARDASSDRFKATLAQAIRLRLEERTLHQQQGGAPVEYRKILHALDAIEKVADELVSPLWDELHASNSLVPGLAESGKIAFSSSPQALVDWLVDQANLTIATGTHDERMVSPSEVGAGLQSLLDLALLESVEALDSRAWLLVEEPEAFLHPSAQRSLAVELLRERGLHRIISTHSPLIVDEARFGDVVLVRGHKLFQPAVSETRRARINSALMSGAGAEALYSRSVLLVEGPGDRAYLEAIRRRIANVDDRGLTSGLGIVSVGGKARFGPWVALLESYVDPATGEQPVRWLAVADSGDAATDLARGIRSAGLSLPVELAKLFTDVSQAFAANDQAEGVERTRRLNSLAADTGVPVALMPIDLEYSALQGISNATRARLARETGLEATNLDGLLRKLGSKYGAGPSDSYVKADWIRALMGVVIPWSQVSDDVKALVRRWLLGSTDDSKAVEDLISSVPETSPDSGLITTA